jgi:SNF2 family DNA or RNA helicase
MKIRQILLHPKVVGLKGKSPKVEWIKQYLNDYPDKKVLIFSNFTEWLKVLGEELDCKNFIIGETTKARREELKKDFQSGKIRLLLINIKAGKEGITLDTADVAIFTDKYPPIGDIQQAEDRFVATTKDKLNTGHTIIDLVMADSYEVNILRLLENNASEVDIINNYIKYLEEVRK